MPNKLDFILFRAFLFWYICGVLLLTFDALPPSLEWANAVFLVLAGLLGGAYFVRNYGYLVGTSISIFIIFFTIFIEWLGVTYGLFFGHYYYNPDFGLFIFELPLTIGFAWLMVIATTHVLAKHLTSKIKKYKMISFSLIGASGAVVMDLILDPVAYHVKEYWVWNTNGIYYGIPFTNFLGWFLLAFCLHLLVYLLLNYFNKWNLEKHYYWRDRMVWLYNMMIFMFGLLAVTNGLILAPIVTFLLASFLLYMYRHKGVIS